MNIVIPLPETPLQHYWIFQTQRYDEYCNNQFYSTAKMLWYEVPCKTKKGLDILFIINLFAADDGYLMYTTGKWWVSIQGFLQHLSLQISLLLEGNEHGSHSHNLLLPLQYFLTVDQYYVERVWTEKLGW